ncbi:MAG TPA: ABC transporter substrate-binding protein [Chloroflexota bacterium]|nr:ABC transporter substrate-binding protein [Chloroflexota bacterium]
MTIAIRGEPGSLSAKRGPGLNLINTRQIFNADLVRLDEHSSPHALLAETLPQLNTDSWIVLPDGRMETVYRLRPNLTWHDGAPLTATDFVFALEVYTTTSLGGFDPTPQNLIQEVVARDPQTVLIRWRQPYPDAGILDSHFSPLPSHLLEEQLHELDGDSFANLPYWTTQYVGAGPYRLDGWEPGTSLDGAAFAGYVLGRPLIDRVHLLVVSDPNAAVAGLLAGTTQIAVDFTIGFEHGQVLRRQWEGGNGGSVLLTPTDRRFLQVQFRPEVVNPTAILDLRVRQALAATIDRQGLNEGLLDGQGILMNSLVLPTDPWFQIVDQSVTKFTYDPREAERLFRAVGYARGADGILTSPRDGRLSVELRVSAGGQNEQQNSIIVEGWKRNGIDATSNPFPVARLRDGEFRATFPALQGSVGGDPNSLISATIPGPTNRWQGSNRGAWSNPEYDRLYSAFNSTLDRNERARQIAQAMKLMTDELPVIPLYYDFGVVAHVAALVGPRQGGDSWNIHEWELE